MKTTLLLAGLPLLGQVSAGSVASTSATDASISTSTGTIKVTKAEQCACKKLAQSFKKDVIFPGQTNYTVQTVDSYWDVRADLSPACVFVPETANAVSSALKIFNQCNAQFAVRGGGHMNVSPSICAIHLLLPRRQFETNIDLVPRIKQH